MILPQGGLHGELFTVALEDDGDGVARVGLPDGGTEIAFVDGDAADGQDDVTLFDAGGLGAGLGGDATHLGSGTFDQLTSNGEHAEQQDDGDQQVHQRPGRDHEHPPGIRLLPVGPRFVGGGHLVEVVHPDDPHERPEREEPNPVLRLPAVETPQPGTEPDEELRRLHSGEPRRHEVAELVEEHGDEHTYGEQQHPPTGQAEPDEQTDDGEPGDRPGSASAERLIGGIALGDRTAGHHLATEALVPRAGKRRWQLAPGAGLFVRLHRISRGHRRQ